MRFKQDEILRAIGFEEDSLNIPSDALKSGRAGVLKLRGPKVPSFTAQGGPCEGTSGGQFGWSKHEP